MRRAAHDRQRRRGWPLVVAFLLLILTLLPVTGALASGSGITMQVTAGFGGQAPPSGWVPLTVDLRNAGADFVGRVVVVEDVGAGGNGPPQPFHSAYSAAVTLPSGGHKQVILYVPAYDAASGSIAVRLEDPGGHAAATATAPIQTVPAGTLLGGVVSADAGTARVLNGVAVDGTTLTAVALSVRDLVPVGAALENFDLLVLSNAPTEGLSVAQGAALRQWVYAGGVLVVAGGPTAQRTVAGLPPDLAPVRVTGTTTLNDLGGLGRLAGAALHGEPVVASTGELAAGTALATQGGVPLVVDAPLGRGHVLYLALDLGLAPFTSLAAASPLWGGLLGPALAPRVGLLATQGGAPGGGPGMQNIWGILNVLNNLPSTAAPSVGLFVALISLYILALGPLNYLVLRRLRRQELSWITIPALAVLFCLGTFLFALQGKGRDVLLNAISVVHLDSAAGARPVESYVGLFSPTRSDYHLAVPGVVLPEALPANGSWGTRPGDATPLGLRFQQGEPTVVDFTNMNMWSLRAVRLRGQTTLPGAIESRLHVGAGGTIVGSVTNRTGRRLVGVGLVTAGGAQLLGALDPNEVRAVAFTVAGPAGAGGPPPLNQLYQQQASGMGAPPPQIVRIAGKGQRVARVMYAGGGAWYPGPSNSQEINNYQQVLQTIFQNGDTSALGQIIFVGWSHDPLTPYTVNGERPHRQDLNLFLQPLALTLSPGPFTLPEGVVAPQLVGSDSANQSGGGGLTIGAGSSATFGFTLPASGRAVTVRRLTVNIAPTGGSFSLTGQSAALYDWGRQAWMTVDLTGGDTPVGRAGRFFSPLGVLRLRLTAPPSQNLSIPNIGAGIQIGAAGVVQ